MERGFVSANCPECGAKHSLTEPEFRGLGLWVSCPVCRGKMTADMLSALRGTVRLAANYGYACFRCQKYVHLADLLPRWDELTRPGPEPTVEAEF
jgi:hypothetical protein